MTLHTFIDKAEVQNRAGFERPDPGTAEAELREAARRRAYYKARQQGLALQLAFEELTLRELESLPWKLVAAGIRAVSQGAPR